MVDRMSDISLSASARNTLLALTSTASLMSRTQSRLTTGLTVSSAIDDAIAYYQAINLTNRAADFSTRKDEINQGISGLSAAVQGTTLVSSILSQMSGIITTVSTADSATRTALSSQFSDLARQINSAVTDANYQGLDLVNNSSASMTVYFSEATKASLTVTAKNLNASKLLTTMGVAASTAGIQMVANMLAAAGAAVGGFSALTSQANLSPAAVLANVTSILDRGINRVRAQSALLGGNVTFLQSRMDFTSNYINTLQEGSGKLTLADLNEEGANLVTLETRQQIGIQALSIAGQQQQSILSLLK